MKTTLKSNLVKRYRELGQENEKLKTVKTMEASQQIAINEMMQDHCRKFFKL